MRKSLLAFALLATSAHAAPGRLPIGVTPIGYDITVRPDATSLTFTGSETITFDVTKPSRAITLNAADLSIDGVMLDVTIPATVSLDAKAQTATFTFPRTIRRGRHTLSMQFAGKINRSASGLFAVDYDGEKGAQERMLVTQFEAPDARRFAPMWDEPSLKATFKLSAVAPAGQTAFSNMPVTGTEPAEGGATLWRFAESPKMSSYLLFLGMGNIDRKTVMSEGVEIGIISRKGVVDQGDYALDSAKRLLTYFNDYFGTPYPLPKLDMIAAPGSSQFFSAMENWGAILYFERVLLIDPKLATEDQKQDVHNVVAHEMAHQWFGNLVTMAWWDDLWLNEGFASWMASKASDDLNPEWGALTQTMAFDRQSAMALDARATTHPIIQKIETVEDISQAFDSITYRKGEAVIRMLEGDAGADGFRNGIRNYMAKYRYGNTVTENLWAEVGKGAGKSVAPYMRTFTLQGGVPLVRASNPVCANGEMRINLTQDRFALDVPSRKGQRWIVPVKFGLARSEVTSTTEISGPRAKTARIAGCGLAVVNRGQTGYFRTLYAPEHFEALRQGFATLSADDQVGLVADAYGLANGGYQPIERYLDLVSGIAPDAAPLVWAVISSEIASIDNMLVDAPERLAFQRRARALLAPVFARTGWEAKRGEAAAVAQLRERLIPVIGGLGDPEVAAQAARYAERGFASPDAVPGAIRIPALRVYAETADAKRWEALRGRAQAEKSPVAKSILYTNLGRANDPALARRALDLALTDEAPVPVRTSIIAAVAGDHPALAFDWAVANADRVNALLEASSKSEFIVELAASSSDPALVGRINAYVAQAGEGTRKPADRIISLINYRAGLRAMQAGAIARWAR